MGSAAPTISALKEGAGRSGCFSDFDGTLAAITSPPDAARPLAGVVDCLGRLARSWARVGVVSGRPIEFLAGIFPFTEIDLYCLYGLQTRVDGEVETVGEAGVWREAVEDVATISRQRGPQGMLVESKGLSLTLHYRTAPQLAQAVEEWALAQAARSGLTVRKARMSVELHPPVLINKGTTLQKAAADVWGAVYIGDDLADLSAFDALDEIEARGGPVLRVGVSSEETPVELLDRSDLAVDGPEGVIGLLAELQV